MFTPVEWSHDSNIYEINLRQYSQEGNFEGFSDALPRLKDMGIEILWFMPITPIAEAGRKGSLGSYYACSDFFTTNPEYGTVADFTALVKKAHQLGFKVIIDWVANHTGLAHSWTKSNPDYFKINEKGEFFDSNGWDDVIDLDYTNDEMRRAMIEAMRYWIKTCNIDGFRCDMAMLVPLDFWIEARTQLDKEKPLFWLAECEEPHYHEAFDVTYTWEWMHKSADFMKNGYNISTLKQLLEKYRTTYSPASMRLYFTTNHDENSWNGTEFEKYGEAHQAFAVLSATLEGLPLIYSGQELPNTKRLLFFDRDPIEWKEPVAYHSFYKQLLSLRKEFECMKAGIKTNELIHLNTTANDQIFAFLRKSATDQVLVLINLSPHNQIGFTFQDAVADGYYLDLLDGGDFRFHPDYRYYQLDAWQFKIFSLKQP